MPILPATVSTLSLRSRPSCSIQDRRIARRRTRPAAEVQSWWPSPRLVRQPTHSSALMDAIRPLASLLRGAAHSVNGSMMALPVLWKKDPTISSALLGFRSTLPSPFSVVSAAFSCEKRGQGCGGNAR